MLPPDALAEAERMGLTPEEFLAQMRAAQQTNGPAVPPEFAADVRSRPGGRRSATGVAAAWLHSTPPRQRGRASSTHRGLPTTVSVWQRSTMPAASFCARYWARGRSGDLDRAVAGWELAVKLTPPDSPDRIARLNNLAPV
jgi:hypothetical protein